VIAIAAQTGLKTGFTEPIPLDFIASEPLRVHENDDNDERINSSESGGFAQILAGLLQNTQTAELSGIEHDFDVSSVDFINDEGSMFNVRNDIFSNVQENIIDSENFTDIDLSDEAIEKTYQKIVSADHLLNNSIKNETGIETLKNPLLEFDAGLLEKNTELSLDRKPSSKSADIQSKNVSANVHSSVNEKNHSDPAMQFNASAELAAKQNAKDVSSGSKNNVKNDNKSSVSDAFSGNDKADVNSAGNKTGDEQSALTDRKANLKNDESSKQLSRLDEYRGKIRKDRVSFEIRDMRTAAANNTLADTSRMTGQVREIALDLRLPENVQSLAANGSQAQASWETNTGQSGFSASLENMLARELHQGFNGDIVRHASMALRDGGAGTIKITLHPETLGNVKIHLEITDNKITGRVVVESQEALNAFRKELNALEQAFKDSGFADASLDLSLTADGFGEERHELENGAFKQQMAASSYEDSYELETAFVVDVYFGRKPPSVNILA